MKDAKSKMIHGGRGGDRKSLISNEKLEIKGLEKDKSYTGKITNTDDLYKGKIESKKSKLNNLIENKESPPINTKRKNIIREDFSSLETNSSNDFNRDNKKSNTNCDESYKKTNYDFNEVSTNATSNFNSTHVGSTENTTNSKLIQGETRLNKNINVYEKKEVRGFKKGTDYRDKITNLDEKYSDSIKDSKYRVDESNDSVKRKRRKNTRLEYKETDQVSKDKDAVFNSEIKEDIKKSKVTFDEEDAKDPNEVKDINKKKSKKKNFRDNQIFTRKKMTKEEILKEAEKLAKEKENLTKTYLKFEDDNKVRKMRKKQDKLNDNLTNPKKNKLKTKDLKGKTLGTASESSGLTADYLSHGSDENTGIEATEKGFRTLESGFNRLSHRKKNKQKKELKKIKSIESKIKTRKSKLEFRSEVKDLKDKEDFIKANRYKKHLKKKQLKNAINKNYETRFRDRIKKQLKEILISSKESVIRNTKKIGETIGLILVLLLLLFQLGGLIGGGIGGITQNIMSTTYLSSEDVLSNVNQEFSSYEYELLEEMQNVEKNHPGYDEYNVKGIELIGHDTHVLLSYITARYGEVKDVSEISKDLAKLFNDTYKLHYESKTEIRYRTVSYSYVDAEGNSHTSSRQEPYEYRILNVTLEKKELDTYAREVFKTYEDNLAHYEALLETKGNMGDIFGNSNYASGGSLDEIVDNKFTKNPGIEFTDSEVKQLFSEAEKHLGKRYVFGANGPSNFDCSSFVCWSFTHSGIKNMPRTTAWLIYKNYTTPISPSDAKPGDIIFFRGTYNSGSPISHVGIYAGNGMMIHAGDPIQYTSINSNYWKQHFYGFGRP